MNKDTRVTTAINTLAEMDESEAAIAFFDIDCLGIDDAMGALTLYQEIDVSDPVKEVMWEDEIVPICDAILGEEEDA